MTPKNYFSTFLKKTGRAPDTLLFDVFHFELTERLANDLLALVLDGKKKATSSSLRAFEIEGMSLPKPGELSVVTNWAGEPKCVIETEKVTLIRFCDIDFGLCSKEGEDECLETWREGHEKFFRAEGRELGYEFSPDMTVVFEEFDVVYKG